MTILFWCVIGLLVLWTVFFSISWYQNAQQMTGVFGSLPAEISMIATLVGLLAIVIALLIHWR